MNKRLLYLVNDPAFFLSHRLSLAQKARDAGYEVHVATPNGNGSAEILRQQFHFHSIPLHRNSLNFAKEFQLFFSLIHLFKKLKPDLLHNITIKPVIFGGIAAKIVGISSVVNAITGLGYVFLIPGLRGTLFREGIRGAYRLALSHPNSKVIFQNPDDETEFLKNNLIDSSQSVLIKGAGVDMKKFSPRPEAKEKPFVLLALRMLFDKGVVEFIEAARQLKSAGIQARFVLVGEPDPGNPATISNEQLQAWNDEGIVEWWGKRNDMPDIFAQSHIVCLPSYREGTPKVLIEAAACGRPIVATNVPGCREVVKNHENGLLVPIKNSQELARAIRTLIENPDMRRKMGQKGRAIVQEEFSEDRVAQATFAVYEELLSHSSR